VSGEGRARRRESVIVVKKIDVHVHAIGSLGIYGGNSENRRSRRKTGVFMDRRQGFEASKIAGLMDIKMSQKVCSFCDKKPCQSAEPMAYLTPKGGRRMAKVIDQAVKKTRYISVRLAGEEVYVENISSEGDLLAAVPAGKLRLREIQKVMPLGNWSLNIEEQWKGRNGKTHFRIVDVTTGKLQESVL